MANIGDIFSNLKYFMNLLAVRILQNNFSQKILLNIIFKNCQHITAQQSFDIILKQKYGSRKILTNQEEHFFEVFVFHVALKQN